MLNGGPSNRSLNYKAGDQMIMRIRWLGLSNPCNFWDSGSPMKLHKQFGMHGKLRFHGSTFVGALHMKSSKWIGLSNQCDV